MIARATISRWAIPPERANTEAFAQFGELEALEQLVGARSRLRGADPEEAAVEVQVLPDRQLAVEGVGLRHGPDQLLGERRVRDDVDASRRWRFPTSARRAS